MEKNRLDIEMEERGLVQSRSLAQKLIMAGDVRVNGQIVLKPAVKVTHADQIDLLEAPRFVSRGGEKLVAALEAFGLTDLTGRVCVDVGASTGGFTDCLLQHGARKVYAVDVGYGVLDWKIRNDQRVVVMERTNARYITGFDDRIELVTVDASFISLSILLPAIRSWFGDLPAEVVALIKPQFEAGRADSAKGGGVIRDPKIHRAVLERTLEFAQNTNFEIMGLIQSPLTGPKGNIEFLVYLSYPKKSDRDLNEFITPLFDSHKDEPLNQASDSIMK
ncbi:MAG: TlyA family RNA methyltransferase [Anaerolineaceae bacterium]|nr:TlyA family RNA methyltransferase [Anaerolineaceae bacterium]